MHILKETNYEINAKRNTFSPVSDADIGESRFF